MSFFCLTSTYDEYVANSIFTHNFTFFVTFVMSSRKEINKIKARRNKKDKFNKRTVVSKRNFLKIFSKKNIFKQFYKIKKFVENLL